ncbi:hypothetical protein M514_08475 [Trichuris suis]|uniref:ABC transmembrane type-1 domain-containing protein n=1 Tax=Trichuris suis TaxID=68888 RepID=A0A085MWI7_9BILA|nr:hypothetical protein M514_08475 [Trichuris suis]
MKPRVEVSFNLSFFRRFWLLLKIMFPRVLSCTVLLAILVLLLGGLDQVLTYNVGVMPSEFYQVLGGRDDDGFRTTLTKSFGLVVGKAVVLTSISYATSILYINWRRLITQRLHTLYFNTFVFYDLNNLFSLKKVDNPDQRIAQDVERTCNVFSEIFSKVVMSPFIIAYYTYKTWDSSGYLGPLSIYSYFIISTIINKFAMSPVVRCVANQEKKEGDFRQVSSVLIGDPDCSRYENSRFKHMAVRSHSEAIAFYHSDSLEKLFTEQRLESLLNAQQKLVNWRFFLNGVTNFVDYFGSILSYIIISIPILLEGKYDNVDPVAISAIISRNSFYYLYLINSFSTLIDLNSKVSDMAGTAHRPPSSNADFYNAVSVIRGFSLAAANCLHVSEIWRSWAYESHLAESRLADRSFGRQVVWPTGRWADRSFDHGRMVVWPTGRLADLSFGRQVVRPTGRLADRSFSLGG